jgi:tetratricopeptide (TPR) repeat protein
VRLRLNRGLVLLQQGRMREAERDFLEAEHAALDGGLLAPAALCRANLAVLRGRSRQLVQAVADFDLARERFREAGDPLRPVAIMHIDRAEVLMHSGLLYDALEAAQRAHQLVEPTENRMLIGDALLLVARTELAAALTARAERSAVRAAAEFEASGRADMVVQAQSIAAHARLRRALDDGTGPVEPDESVVVIERLRRHGWDRQADELALDRIRLAASAGDLAPVREEVHRLRSAADSDQRDMALVGLLVEAYAARAAGLFDDAIESAKRGLGRLDDIVAEAPTLEERSAVMRLGSELSRMVIDVAVEVGDAETVLAAAEGTRARALHDELAERDRHRPLTDAGAALLRDELASRLDRRQLVEWIVSCGRVFAVVFDRTGARLVDVAGEPDVVRLRDRVVAHLDLAVSEPDGSSARAVAVSSQLDELLMGPLELDDEVEVVMVPVGVLHGIPWSGLRTFAGRPVTLSPNAQVWLEADRLASVPAVGVGLLVGPDVEEAALERDAVERSYRSVTVASGAGATASALASMLGAHGLVHVAAHGRFRSDRPLLSTLRLDGREATLHETVPQVVDTRIVVLSSCEGGALGSLDGSEVLGFGSVLLARGASALVAPLTNVRDLECASFVAELHGELAGGQAVAAAAASVRERWLGDDDLSRWAVASAFACFGSGSARVAV